MYLTLKLVSGEQIEQSINSNVFIIGRSAKCDVVVAHDGMSRQHCQIEVNQGEIFVTDLGSTNGVFIDGHKITPHTRTSYASYLTLSFGAVQSLAIELDDRTGRHAPPASRTISSNLTSVTKSLKDTSPSQETRVLSQTPKKKTRGWLINLLVVLILGAAFWLYQLDKKTATRNSDEISDEAYDDELLDATEK